MPWFDGPSLLEHLDTVALDADEDAGKALRMPVQWVNRPNQDFRGFAGQIASGGGSRDHRMCVCCRPAGRRASNGSSPPTAISSDLLRFITCGASTTASRR